MEHSSTFKFLKKEYLFILSLFIALFFLEYKSLLIDNLSSSLISFIFFFIIFLTMLFSSFSVVRHADELAIKLGEPYGTLILTLSVITIEVIAISSVMLIGEDNPSLGRDMMFSVIMITLNGLVGLSLIVGALKHIEQDYNLQGVNSFLAVIVPLAIIGMILPNYTLSTEYGTFSILQTYFIIFITVAIYFTFLALQTMRHKTFFILHSENINKHSHEHKPSSHSTAYHVIMILAYLIPIVLLSKKLAIIVNHSITTVGAPAALGGLLIAILVLAPEGMSAIKVAFNNQLQRSINITMGSALATIALTIPAVLFIGLITGKKVILGLGDVDIVLLSITLLVIMINFSSGKSNLIQGMTHLILFTLYLLLIFD